MKYKRVRARRRARSGRGPARALTAAVGVLSAVLGTPAIACAHPFTGPHHREIVVIGDSFTGGSAEGGTGPKSWTELSWTRLRADGIDVAPEVSGEGGAGFVARGTDGTTLPEEARRLVAAQDEVVVYFGGLNDQNADQGALRAAVRQTLSETRVKVPCARLLLVGPASLGDPGPRISAVRDVLRHEAEDFGAVFVDPIADRWFADSPELIGRDHIHPTDQGHQYMADRLAPVVESLLQTHPGC
ncbi:SGNH/GDSL hydrolase family protein [Mycobacterium sp. CPCC 205372]|uniref:SGNH/GDSL hydrolase family protein n=1 Tax=Mycobacterium hippophais TaxID=3016340 RepID=A0ABT4PRU5_9MYCO|nr:SGNH/GDSL hydrolase family protein [Mycobacterium hippophais]MCZ8379287.1 SGNH/GDSL hydrolase family protein [Mycobacterium hippophais]